MPPGAAQIAPPDEAPDRMEEVTRTQALGTLTGHIAPADDVDWYRFELTKTMRLRVTLADLPAALLAGAYAGENNLRTGQTCSGEVARAVGSLRPGLSPRSL